MSKFKKGLSDNFMAALAELAQKPGWWQDVLADPSLIIGVRDEKFDVYWNGQSLFNADFQGGRVNVNTHVKYLLDPDRSDRVALKADGSFHVMATPMIEKYAEGVLGKLKRAADLFSGREKQGVHAIAQANANVVDVEVRLDAKDLDTDRDQPRIDIAAFEQQADGVELVFWEAKLFVNKELRAAGASSKAKVVKQIEEYRRVLALREAEVRDAYERVAKNLVAMAKLSEGARKVGPAILAVAEGARVRLNVLPHVGLAIFGFDADQKAKDSIGRKHFDKLEEQLGSKFVRLRGEADGLKL